MYKITVRRVQQSSEYLIPNRESLGFSETSVTIRKPIRRSISDDWHLHISTLLPESKLYLFFKAVATLGCVTDNNTIVQRGKSRTCACCNIYIYIYIYIYISSVICQTIGPKPHQKRFLHIVRSRASSFN